jgi:hypothetical protein
MKRTAYIVVAAVALIAGCATPPKGSLLVESPSELPSAQQKHASRLSQVKIGMSLEEFQTLFPEAYVGGESEKTTAYEIVDIQKYVTQDDIDRQNLWWGFGSPRARTEKRVLWFYFFGGKLVKWGRPQDWPERPDLIIERRER